MRSKLNKYYHYVLKFAKSHHKREIINELGEEVRSKGVVGGIRSLLHRRMHQKGADNNDDTGINISLADFDRAMRVSLPQVDTPLVSVIIPMYNQLDFTVNCIYSVFLNCGIDSYEVIVADDKSTVDSSVLQEYFQHIVVIRNTENLGFLNNCNHAVSKARGKYVVLLNNDTQVQAGWLKELVATFDNDPQTGLAGSKLVYPNGKLQEAGGIIWRDGSGWNYGNGDHPGKPEYNYVKETDYISGAAIMMRRSLWDEMGGFDDHFAPAYYEDTDLCFRVRQRGYKVVYQPFSVVVHFEGVTHGKDLGTGIKQYQVVNRQKFTERWKDELNKKPENGQQVFFARDRTAGKKHVLVVDHYLPQIDKDAGSRCISSFMDAMLGLGYMVSFLGENQVYSQAYYQSFQQKGVEVLYGSRFNFFDQSWKGYLKDNMANFDAILLSRASVCRPILEWLRGNDWAGNAVYFGHDLGFRRLEAEAAAKNDDAMSRLAARIKGDEDYMYSHADNSLVLSVDELEYLRKYITTPLHYVPAFFYDVAGDIAGYEAREGLLFVGGFNHPPNQDAVVWFLDSIYDRLYRQGIPLTIVGSKMPAFMAEYKKKFPSLQIRSDIPVEELNALYDRTRIAIVPLRYGAGVKGKVIEAMAKGVPVVGTDIAFEGMPKDGDFKYKGLNTPQEIADGISALYTNEARWQQLSGFGMGYVKAYFSMEQIAKVFKDVVG